MGCCFSYEKAEGETSLHTGFGRDVKEGLGGATRGVVGGDTNIFLVAVSEVEGAIEHLDLTEEHLGAGGAARLATKYPNLQSVRFDLGNDIGSTVWDPSDSHIAQLWKLESLTSVDASGCHFISKKGISKISHDPGRIVSLIFNNCDQLQDDVISTLTLFSNLQTLSLRGCQQLTQNAVINLKHLPSLTHLDLSLYVNVSVWDKDIDEADLISTEAMEAIGTLTKLTHLELESLDQVTNIGMNGLSTLKELVYLNMSKTQISDSALYIISAFTKLLSLKLGACPISDLAVPKLATLTGLTHLDMSHKGGFSDPSLEKLQVLTNLTHLDTSFCGYITGKGIPYLAEYPKLTYLDVGGCAGINDAACAELAKLTRLQRLSLNRCDAVTDDGVAMLTALTALTHLEFGSTGFKDVQVNRLSEITTLTDITLHWVCKAENNRFTDLNRMGLNVHVV